MKFEIKIAENTLDEMLRDDILSRWELRVDKYRVIYNVNEKDRIVDITAVGYKKHNKLFIGGKEIKI